MGNKRTIAERAQGYFAAVINMWFNSRGALARVKAQQ